MARLERLELPIRCLEGNRADYDLDIRLDSPNSNPDASIQ
jgi:hypothetical protein